MHVVDVMYDKILCFVLLYVMLDRIGIQFRSYYNKKTKINFRF